MKIAARAANAGFSLLEIMVAMVLLAGVSLAVMSSFSSSSRVANSGGQLNVAYNFGRGVLERLHEFVLADATWTTSGNPLSLDAPGPQGLATTLNGDTFSVNYEVNESTLAMVDEDADGLEDYRRVRMTVAW